MDRSRRAPSRVPFVAGTRCRVARRSSRTRRRPTQSSSLSSPSTPHSTTLGMPSCLFGFSLLKVIITKVIFLLRTYPALVLPSKIWCHIPKREGKLKTNQNRILFRFNLNQRSEEKCNDPNILKSFSTEKKIVES